MLAAEVILAAMSWAAKMERSAVNERIAAARERVESEGRTWGRPRRLGEDDVQKVLALRDAGRSLKGS